MTVSSLTLLVLGGCSTLEDINPINVFRDLTGASKNDPSPDARNSANLENGSKIPYPNLAGVPNIPTRGLSKEDKEKLAQALVADRDNARHTDDQVRAGNASATVPALGALPDERLPTVGEVTREGPPPSGEAAPAQTNRRLSVGGALGLRNPRPQPAAQESTLAPPIPRAVPQAETPRETPAPAEIAPLPPPVPVQPPEGIPAPRTDIPADAPPPVPEAAPPVPQLAQVPRPAGATPPAGKRTKSAQVARLVFGPGTTGLTDEALVQLQAVPALHTQYGGIVRVVGYASPAPGADPAGAQLAAFQAALERANLVKDTLVKSGIPVAEILTEAAPVQANGRNADRTDIYVEY